MQNPRKPDRGRLPVCLGQLSHRGEPIVTNAADRQAFARMVTRSWCFGRGACGMAGRAINYTVLGKLMCEANGQTSNHRKTQPTLAMLAPRDQNSRRPGQATTSHNWTQSTLRKQAYMDRKRRPYGKERHLQDSGSLSSRTGASSLSRIPGFSTGWCKDRGTGMSSTEPIKWKRKTRVRLSW